MLTIESHNLMWPRKRIISMTLCTNDWIGFALEISKNGRQDNFSHRLLFVVDYECFFFDEKFDYFLLNVLRVGIQFIGIDIWEKEK